MDLKKHTRKSILIKKDELLAIDSSLSMEQRINNLQAKIQSIRMSISQKQQDIELCEEELQKE